MKFNNPVEIPAARIAGVSHKFKEGVVESVLKVSGFMTPDLAADFGCVTALYAGDQPREGFESVKLDTGCDSFNARLEPNGVELANHTLSIVGECADSFVVSRDKENLTLEFKLHYHGDPFGALKYLLAIGEGAGVCYITPAQQDLMAAKGKPEPVSKPKQDRLEKIVN